MKKIIKEILNKRVTWSNPTSITLLEWFCKKENENIEKFYLNDKSYFFHKKSVEKSDYSKHYLDYNLISIRNNIDGQYFDDLSFDEEILRKVLVLDSKIFFENRIASIGKEAIRKFLFIINEIERNVRNHAYEDDSEQNKISYCANYYSIQNKGKDESIIIYNISDYGMGFEKRRDDNKSYSILSTQGNSIDAEHYVLEAVRPTVTTKTNLNKVSNSDNENSGYGLYLLNKIASHNLNKLEILSDGKLFINDIGKRTLKYGYNFPEFKGITSISLTFRISTLSDIFKELENGKYSFSVKSNYSKAN